MPGATSDAVVGVSVSGLTALLSHAGGPDESEAAASAAPQPRRGVNGSGAGARPLCNLLGCDL